MDLSATHERVGFLMIPREPESEPEATTPSDKFDGLDIGRVHEKTLALYKHASGRVDSTVISADERQLWLGQKLAYATILGLFNPSGQKPKAASDPSTV